MSTHLSMQRLFRGFLSQAFFACSAEVVSPNLLGCLLVKSQKKGGMPWCMITLM
jgi:3-methyladenine DNA glycosylase Mpg